MKCVFLFFILAFVALCFADDFYVSVDGSDSNSCTDDSDACASLQGVLNHTNATEITINVADGTYSGVNNTGITYPNATITISGDDDDETMAIFNCMGNGFGFNVVADFTLNRVNIKNCTSGGILSGFGDGVFADLTLQDVSFTNNGGNDIYYDGTQTIDLDDCDFTNSTGIHITSANIVAIEDSNFENVAGNSIYFDYQSNTESIDVEDCTFTNSAGIFFLVGSETDTNCTLNKITFDSVSPAIGDGSQHSALVYLNGGDWKVGEFTASNSIGCTVMQYVDAGNGGLADLVVSDSTFNACETGISFNADDAQLQVGSSSFNCSTFGIDVQNCEDIKLYNGISFDNGGISVNNKHQTIRVDLEDLTFTNAKTSVFSLDATANATMVNSKFTNSQGQSLSINGGDWGLSNVEFSNSEKIIVNGGAISITGATVNNSLTVDGCTFSNSSTTQSGGAIYASSVILAIDGTTFENCNADVNGGAVAIVGLSKFSAKGSNFDSNSAGGVGGGIYFRSSGVATAKVENLDFDSNNATNGAAMSCACDTGVTCNITIGYDSDDTVSFENNVNTNADGTDVTCETTIEPFSSAAQEPDASVGTLSTISSSGLGWVFWLVISISIVIVIALIVGAALAAFFFYKKRRSYDTVE